MIKLKNLINEENSIQYGYAETFAKKYKIKYKPVKNKYNDLVQIEYYGSADQFFKDKKKSKFAQVTDPTGFDNKSTGKINIGLMIPSKPGNHVGVTYNVNS